MIINTDHKGRTASGRITWRPLVQLDEDDFPPDSKYWHMRAMAAARQLADLVGYGAYCAWVDAQPEWPHWRGLHDLVEAELGKTAKQPCLQNSMESPICHKNEA